MARASSRKEKSHPLDRLLTDDQLAEILGICTQTLRNARSTGVGAYASIPWIKVQPSNRRSAIRYRRRDVERWLDQRVQEAAP